MTWARSRVRSPPPGQPSELHDRGDGNGEKERRRRDLERGETASAAPPASTGEEGEAASFVANLLARAIRGGVSDVHLEPTGEGRGRIRLRRDARLSLADAVPPGLFPRLVGRLKLLGRLDVAEQRRPQEGWIEGFKCDDRTFDLRVATAVTHLGERLTVRLLGRGAAMVPLERLGFFPDDLERMRGLCARPHGLVIVAGPAGSGKTSVLYSMIREIDRDTRCVVTIEDPVHFLLPGTVQIPCGAERGLPPAIAVRSAMRQDPDVLVIGEFDDQETIREALKAEKSGHLVLAQLHARNAAGAVQGLLDFGIEPFRINTSLTAAISLRVVRKLCPECREARRLDPDAWPEEVIEILDQQESVTLHEAIGCPNCGGTGYRDRAGIFEILVPDDAFRATVSAGTDRLGLAGAARATGMRPMLESGLALAAAGEASVEEVVRVLR